MAKKDFSASTEDVFTTFFSQPTKTEKKVENRAEEPKKIVSKTETKKEEKTTPKVETKKTTKKATVTNTKHKKESKPTEEKKEEISTPEVETENSKTTPKSYNKDCRQNFYLDIELADFVTNYLWITRHRSYSKYFNQLIKQDLLKILGLPADTSNEEMAKKWEEYKKENNI